MGLRGRGARPVGTKAYRRREVWRDLKLSRAARVVKFIESLRLTSGVHAGRKFRLRSWQKDIIAKIYRTEAGRRTARQALVTIPRKNGKTQLAAALALAHLSGPEAEARGQVFSAAADRQQAALIYREMCAFIRADEKLADRTIIRDYFKTIEDVETGSVYEALSSDARKAHGLSPSFVVCDELAQWHGRDLYDNLLTGTGARAEPLVVVISTKSPDANHVMTELVRYGEQVRDGDIVDNAFVPIIFAAPADADPWAEATWHACNPALGDFRSLDEMRVAAEQAKRLPAREPSFRLLYLNQPIDAAARFLHRVDWGACKRDAVDPSLPPLSGARCILGLDLSSTTDLTALAAFFPDTGDLLTWFWAPADGLEEAERRDHVPYRLWARQGLLETTPGRAIDKSFVVHRLGEIVATYKVEACAYDRWRIEEVNRLLGDEGIKLNMVPFGQGWKDMAPAIDALETLVLQRKLHHHDHPVMNWCVSNAVTLSDPTGARKLAKDRSSGRIDGLVAAAMSVGLAVKTPPKKPSVYQSRGLIAVGA